MATVDAPIDKVWRLVSEPSAYDSWVDAALISTDPPGPMHADQIVLMRTRGAGRWWPVRFDVLEVEATEHRVALDVHLPLGIVNHEVITCRAVSETQTLVGFN
jgi:Polyketide cyclase / dehydrase and lipid transport